MLMFAADVVLTSELHGLTGRNPLWLGPFGAVTLDLLGPYSQSIGNRHVDRSRRA
jgi:hypothetical protein